MKARDLIVALDGLTNEEKELEVMLDTDCFPVSLSEVRVEILELDGRPVTGKRHEPRVVLS